MAAIQPGVRLQVHLSPSASQAAMTALQVRKRRKGYASWPSWRPSSSGAERLCLLAAMAAIQLGHVLYEYEYDAGGRRPHLAFWPPWRPSSFLNLPCRMPPESCVSAGLCIHSVCLCVYACQLWCEHELPTHMPDVTPTVLFTISELHSHILLGCVHATVCKDTDCILYDHANYTLTHTTRVCSMHGARGHVITRRRTCGQHVSDMA